MTTHVVLGTGTIGAPLIRELTARGQRVLAVNRSGSRAGIPAGTELLVGDLSDPDFARRALRDADVAYQLTMPPYHRWQQAFPTLATSVLEAASATATRLVLGDNLYSYGPPDGPLSNANPERPTTVKGRVRQSIAHEALEAHRAGRVVVALTRPSNFFGADYALTRDLLVGPALRGARMSVLGRLDQPHAFGYPPDIARAMADIGDSDDAWGRSWVVPALEPLTQGDLCARIWRRAGQHGRPKVAALRGLPLRMVGLFSAQLRASAEMVYEFDRPFLVDAHEFEARFGWSATPVDEAIDATVTGIKRGLASASSV
ncbi:NAD-dependent epimerase/dehydratase family protein [Demequina sp. NBRC 110054]|uniref:NAD-dependent epimerase/dehydratase family protein n=1 Tax=Demequina sp. NBRC 110054 TaxID=1570343 RepID=UPI0009FD87DC|nr:NAD-dependent epimerase/dehydratase family protein [Demequina sp. NBRC 110054]